MTGLTFDIDRFLVAQLTANELGINSKFNVQFIEYYIPSTYVDEINEIKQTYSNWYELEDGAIHFNIIEYTPFVEGDET